MPVLLLSAYPLEGLRVDGLVTLRELEGRQNNLGSVNVQRQTQTREKVERELAAARQAGESLSQRELARRAGVSREGLLEVLGKQADTNYGEWPTLRQKNIGEEKEVETIDPLLVQASVHSSQVPVSPEFPQGEAGKPRRGAAGAGGRMARGMAGGLYRTGRDHPV